MTRTHERFETLLDIRHDHEVIDDGVGWLSCDDARLGDADIPSGMHALLAVPDGRALHRAFHRARAATGADIQIAESHFVADFLRVVVFGGADRMPAPTNNEVGTAAIIEHTRIAQDV